MLSGPPINWRNNFVAWQRPKEELEEEQRKIEDTAKLLGWEKKHEKGEIAIWRKRLGFHHDQDPQPTMCDSRNADDVWYVTYLIFWTLLQIQCISQLVDVVKSCMHPLQL